MTSRTRNFSILGLVLVLLAAAAFVIEDKSTKLGLDLKGGIELVYQGQPTPQVPTVTPQALDDALETIRKRTDALGVSEPEIQRSGRDQISIGLPDVQNAERAIQQVGSTAQLQFYDWEPNVLGRGPDVPFAGSKALYDAAEFASKQKPKAEQTDVPEGSNDAGEGRQAERQLSDPRYYLFGPDRYPIGPTRSRSARASTSPPPAARACWPTTSRPARRSSTRRARVPVGARGARLGGPPAGSRVIKVPRGIVIVEGEKAPNQSDRVHRFFVIEDDSELNGKEIKNPEQAFDPNTNEPLVNMEFTDKGREAFARVTKRIAERGRDCETLAGVDELPAGLGPRTSSSASRSRWTTRSSRWRRSTTRRIPRASTGAPALDPEHRRIQDAQDLAENLRIGALPIDLKLISQTQVSATLGQQALDQGLTAAAAGLAARSSSS